MSFPFYYLKVWGMSFSDKIFMTKIQRPQIFVCQKYFIALRSTNKKKTILRVFICSIPKMEGLGGKVMGFFWAHAWFVQCPWDLGSRGPGLLGLSFGFHKGLRGAMQWVSFGPMPGLSLLGVLFFHYMVSNKYQWQKRYICF